MKMMRLRRRESEADQRQHPGGVRFNLRELGGALGDFGPLHPFFIAYVKLLGMDASSILLVMGLSNLAIGAYYKLPLPIEPQKAIAIYALAQRWPPSLVYATAFGTAVTWLILSYAGLIKRLSEHVPECTARGIQLALAFLFLIESFKLLKDNWLIGGISLALIALFSLTLLKKWIPATIALFILGIFLASTAAEPPLQLTLYIPRIRLFAPDQVALGMFEVGFAQLFLTLSNAIVATRLSVNERFSRRIRDEQLAKNMGFMNVLAAFLGCIPLCHGAGGFASQYFYGARTGGAMIMEGIIELSAALLFSQLALMVFSNFPTAIIGAMLLPSVVELGKTALKLQGKLEITVAITTAVTSVLTNLGVGFVIGVSLYYALARIGRTLGENHLLKSLCRSGHRSLTLRGRFHLLTSIYSALRG